MRDTIHFNSCVGYCSLTIESMQNCYEIRILPDGTETMFHNLRELPANTGWPNRSPLQLPLIRAVESNKADILAYMAETDKAKRNALWWKIQDNLKAGEDMTAREASKIIRQELEAQKIPFSTVSAKTISFSDLARGERIFVTVTGWERGYASPSRYALIADIAKKNGFSVDVV